MVYCYARPSRLRCGAINSTTHALWTRHQVLSSSEGYGWHRAMTVLMLRGLGGEAGDLQPLDSYRPAEMVVAGRREGGRGGRDGLGGYTLGVSSRKKERGEWLNLPGQTKLARIHVHFFNTMCTRSVPSAGAQRRRHIDERHPH